MSPRPLIRVGPDGRRYADPYVTPNPPRHSDATETPQPASDVETGPEPASGSTRPKLSDDDVRAIRRDYAAGRWSMADLAYIHDVSHGTIQSLLAGRTYADVKPEPEPEEQD
jgi:hypothetical protein